MKDEPGEELPAVSFVEWAQGALDDSVAAEEAMRQTLAGRPFAVAGAYLVEALISGMPDGSPVVLPAVDPITGKQRTTTVPVGDGAIAVGAAIGILNYYAPPGGWPQDPGDRAAREAAIVDAYKRGHRSGEGGGP